MPTFNRNDTNAILAFFGQTSTRGSTQPRDEEYYTTNTPSRPTTTNSSTRRPSSNVVTPTTASGGLPPRRYDPLSSAYTNQPNSQAAKKTPVRPPAPKVKRNTSQPRDEEYYTNTEPPNRWRQEIQQPVFRGYDVGPGPQVNVSVGQRPNTGASAVQQSGTIGGQTVRSPITPRLPAYNGPADDAFYTQRDAPSQPAPFVPSRNQAAAPTLAPQLAQWAWDAIPPREEWGNVANRIGQAAREWVASTPALERAQYDIDERTRQRALDKNWGWNDWATNAGQNIADAWGGLQNAMAEQTLGRGDPAAVLGGTAMAVLTPVGQALNVTNPTRRLKDFALDTMSGLQGAQDLLYNGSWLPNNRALSDYMTPFLETVQNDPNRKQMEQVTPEMMMRRWGDFWKQYNKNFDTYQQAITPTAAERARMTPAEVQQQQDRARLRSFAGSEFMGNTFDKLVNQQQNVDSLNRQAMSLFQQGAMVADEKERQKLWQQAAQLGADAYQLKSSHPVQLVNEGFSWQELAAQLVLPDVTDLAAGAFSLLDLTPKARRLVSTVDEVMTPQQQAVRALQDMVVTPATQAATMAERSSYNKAWNLWTTGNARANIATDKMVRYVVNLLGDVETPGDARLLLNQLATDPTKLVTGMAANVFQSPGLLARANEKGLVQFGAMNLQNLKEPLRIYQQAAQNILENSTALRGGPILDKLTFVNEFMDGVRQAGYRFYNVADDAAGAVPLGAKTSRLRAVTGGQYVVEWVDQGKKVIGASEPMLIQDARKLQNAFKGGQITAPQSVISKAGSAMRKLVSVPYILGNPGTWVTNAVSGAATAMGDGVWSTATNKVMDEWKAKLWGIDPTVRGLEGADTAQGFAQNTMGGGIFSWLRNKYGQIDENAGRRVWHASAQHALRKAGKPILQQTLTPILQSMGITNGRQIKRITNHLFEVAYQGGDMVGEWARLMNGNARVFSLSDVNPQWLGALSEPALESFYDILKTATTKEEAVARLQAWTDTATKYWDDLVQGQQAAPQRHVWMKQELAQDAADLTQTARNAQKYGGVPAEEATAWVQQTTTAMQDSQRRMETLKQLIADTKDPKNRYALYNAWGQITDLTADVRAQLNELAEKAGQTPPGPARSIAWELHWQTAKKLWPERNQAVNNLLEQTATAITSGQDFTPHLDVWKTLERSAQTNEAKLWDALRLEPQSGAYDQRLRQVIDAGRQIADKSQARVYAAARRFADVDAMDYIISAEHSVQTAGAQARAYLDRVLEKALKSGKWEDYYSIRNETWRQLRAYERDVWGLAERNIVSDGLAAEATTGLRFDAGPDGAVELVRPNQRTVQQTNRLGPEKTVTDRQVTEWIVKREDGTITTVPENMVPQELKDRYNGVTPTEIESQVQLEMDNIASAEPFAPEAQAILDAPAAQAPTQVYQPSQAQIDQVRASVQKAIDRSAQRNKLTPQQVEAYVTQALTQLSQSDIAVAVPKNVIDSILSDGRIKTQFETGTSSATFNKAERANVERLGLGIPETLPEAQRPVYGYLNFSPDTRKLTQREYGEISFVLDEKVRPRTTIAVGDSARQFKEGNLVGVPIDSPNVLAADHEVSNLVDYARTGDAKEFTYSGVGYVEAQVQGGVTLDDVGYVLDEKGVLTPQQVQQFQQRGIQVLQGEAAKLEGAAPPPMRLVGPDPETTPVSLNDIRRKATDRDLADIERTLTGVNLEARNIPDAIAGQVEGHGLSSLNDLDTLLTRGIDPNRQFFTAPLNGKQAGQSGYGVTIRDAGSFVVIGAPGQTLKQSGIRAVLLDDLYAPYASDLARLYPNVEFIPAAEASTRLGALVSISPTPVTLNDLRRLADEAGIQTASEAGQPINKRLLNTINKDLKIKATRLEDLTPDQLEQAAEALRRRASNTRTLESTTPLFDYQKWARENVAKSLNLSADLKPQALATKTAEAAGDLGQGAAYARQQIQNIYNHVVNNLDEILTPHPGIGQGQSLRAIDEFRTKVLPAWDNAKYIASEYGNKMRSFTLIDFANNTRLDELLSLYMPYGFWMTRTAKNSLERAIFEPQIWRRVMQTEQGVRNIQEQRDDPQRYEGAMPYDDGSGIVQYLRLLPSKYWQAAGIFTHNDYADPESANSALGFAVDSLRAANLNSYPWFDVAAKIAEGNTDDLYLANYLPQGRILADLAIMGFGQQAAQYVAPGYFENSVARVLNNMAVKGEITKEQARWAHDLLWQQKNGGQPLPEQSTVADLPAVQAILDQAMRTAAGQDFQGAASSWLSGVGVRPFDTAEKEWAGAQQAYYENQYGPQNPYGSHLASQAERDTAALGWSKSGVWRPEDGRPGQMLVNDLKKQERETINQDLMSATDAWILSQPELPTNKEINDFKTQYVAQKLGAEGDYYGDMITGYLDERYPSAQPFQGNGGPRYKGYAPEEIKDAVRVQAYYQAKEDITAPTYPGDGKSREEYKAYYEAKAAYEDELEARVDQLINDPQWLAIQSGTFLRTTRTGESEGSYRLIEPTLGNAFGVPVRPTGAPEKPTQSGLVPLAGSPETAKDIIIGERTKYMGPAEREARAQNEANGDKSGRFSARGNRRYSSRYRRSYGGGGYRRYSGGGGGGGGGFRYTDMPQAQGLDSSLWSQDAIRAWRPWNNQANDWLQAGRGIGPDRLEDWRPLKV